MKIFIEKVKNIYSKQQFNPTFVGIFINPLYFIRKGLYSTIKNYSKNLKGVLLDFGCGNKPYKSLFQVDKYIGLDIEKSGHDHCDEEIDIFYDGIKIPFENDFFDSIFSSEVLEHLFNPEEIIKELSRVLKKGGFLLITCPFVWDEHEVPFDSTRYTSYGLKNLIEKNGFNILYFEKTTNYIEAIFQMLAAYVNQHVLPKNKYFNFLFNIIFVPPIIISGIILSRILPKNKNFYSNNVVLATKK